MLEKLRQLGWSEYEAKAYLALLGRHPATGYGVGKASGVPTAKVYEALAKLVERGAAQLLEAEEGANAQYAPVAPDEVMGGLRARSAQMLDVLGQELTALLAAPTEANAEFARLRGRAPVMGRANALLAAARQSVALALPPGWEAGLQAGLDAAHARRVRLDRATLAPDGSLALTPQPASGLIVLVVDGLTTLVGTLGAVSDDAGTEAVTLQTPFVARLCADYVRLRRAVALVPELNTRIQRDDEWMDWEEAKQRRLLETIARAQKTPPAAPN